LPVAREETKNAADLFVQIDGVAGR